MKPLEKQLIFTYTTEDLFLLQEVYFETSCKDKFRRDNFTGSPIGIHKNGVLCFVDWLMQEDRTKLL